MDDVQNQLAKPSSDEVRRLWKMQSLEPLWESPTAHKPDPGPEAAHIWHWSDVRPLIEHAFHETSPAAVERRVLQYIPPRAIEAGEERTVGNLTAALQCLLPGEVARPHRHTMNAVRFVIEEGGVITEVDGKDCPMEYGDLVLTPAWCWHGHRHEGSKPSIWLDVLDVPLHMALGTVVFQPPPMMDMPKTMADAAFMVPNILPVERLETRTHSPIYRYPYSDALKALAVAPASPDGARRVRYANPETGGPAMSLLDSLMIEIDVGTTTLPTRSNASIFCLVVEGEGAVTIGDQTLSFAARDTFTVPPGNWRTMTAISDKVRIYQVSDVDMLQRLGLLREEAGDAA